jgi:hypothetical protein
MLPHLSLYRKRLRHAYGPLEPDARHFYRPRLAFLAADVDDAGGEELADDGGTGALDGVHGRVRARLLSDPAARYRGKWGIMTCGGDLKCFLENSRRR